MPVRLNDGTLLSEGRSLVLLDWSGASRHRQLGDIEQAATPLLFFPAHN